MRSTSHVRCLYRLFYVLKESWAREEVRAKRVTASLRRSTKEICQHSPWYDGQKRWLYLRERAVLLPIYHDKAAMASLGALGSLALRSFAFQSAKNLCVERIQAKVDIGMMAWQAVIGCPCSAALHGTCANDADWFKPGANNISVPLGGFW